MVVRGGGRTPDGDDNVAQNLGRPLPICKQGNLNLSTPGLCWVWLARYLSGPVTGPVTGPVGYCEMRGLLCNRGFHAFLRSRNARGARTPANRKLTLAHHYCSFYIMHAVFVLSSSNSTVDCRKVNTNEPHISSRLSIVATSNLQTQSNASQNSASHDEQQK